MLLIAMVLTDAHSSHTVHACTLRLFVGNIMELLIPYASYWFKYRNEVQRATGDMSQPEREYLLDKVSTVDRWQQLLYAARYDVYTVCMCAYIYAYADVAVR